MSDPKIPAILPNYKEMETTAARSVVIDILLFCGFLLAQNITAALFTGLVIAGKPVWSIVTVGVLWVVTGGCMVRVARSLRDSHANLVLVRDHKRAIHAVLAHPNVAKEAWFFFNYCQRMHPDNMWHALLMFHAHLTKTTATPVNGHVGDGFDDPIEDD
ncbi:hypothetical protein HYW18_03615 [Candidatus Uhrbacteria bacterium]|nr:hypothetical protein [Candidatus Uhrbacteria bacterium]